MGVFVPFWQGGLNLRLVALVVSIQPFAYVVANYTCHDRNNESNKYIHRKVRAPSLCRYRGGNKIKYSIISFKSKGQKALFLSEKIWKNECFFLIPLCHRFAGRNVRWHLPGGRKASCPGRIAAVLLLSYLFSWFKNSWLPDISITEHPSKTRVALTAYRLRLAPCFRKIICDLRKSATKSCFWTLKTE